MDKAIEEGRRLILEHITCTECIPTDNEILLPADCCYSVDDIVASLKLDGYIE